MVDLATLDTDPLCIFYFQSEMRCIGVFSIWVCFVFVLLVDFIA